jgi:hypothetical protein
MTPIAQMSRLTVFGILRSCRQMFNLERRQHSLGSDVHVAASKNGRKELLEMIGGACYPVSRRRSRY